MGHSAQSFLTSILLTPPPPVAAPTPRQVWKFNLFTPNEQVGDHGIVINDLHVGHYSGSLSGTEITMSVEVTRAPFGHQI